MTVFRKPVSENLSEKGKAVLTEIGIDLPTLLFTGGTLLHFEVNQCIFKGPKNRPVYLKWDTYGATWVLP